MKPIEVGAVENRSRFCRGKSVHVFDGAFNLLFGQRPIIVEISDHLFHEHLGELNGAILVAEVVIENGKR